MAKLGNLYYDITLDDGQLRAALQRVKAELKGMDNQLLSLSQNSGGKQLSNAFDVTGKSIEQVKNQMNTLVQAYNKLDMSGNAADAEKVRQRWLELQQVLASYGVTVRNATMESRTFAQVQAMESNTIAQITAKMQALVAARARENVNTAQGQRNISAINSEYQRLNTTLQSLGAKQASFNNNLLSMGNIASQIGGRLQSAFSLAALEQLGSTIINTRGEIQQLEIALETMLGSKVKADKMMQDIMVFAQETPFTLTEVASNTKQLMAMGIAADDVMTTMKALGDVAAGVSVPISRIAINYGQVSALGKLQQREIRDFAMAGIPIVEELSKVMGKTVEEVSALVSAGRVGFPEVREAFISMSSEGGKFYNLMSKQNASVTGQISKLKDQLQLMFNEIGKANEGVIYSGIGGLAYLVENYEKVAKILAALVVTYGAYRTAIYLASLAEKQQLLSVTLLEKAQKLLNATMMKNPIVAVTVVVVGLATAMWALRDSTTAAEKAQAKFNQQQSDAADIENQRKNELEQLVRALQDETTASTEKYRVLELLRKSYPKLVEQYIDEKGHVRDLVGLWKSYNEQVAKNRMQSNRELYDKAQTRVTQAEQKLKEAQNSNTLRSQRIRDAQEELDQARADLKPYEDKIQADRVASFLSNIESMTDSQIQAEISARKKIIDRLNKENKKIGSTKGGVLDGGFNVDQLTDQTKSLEAELEKRKVVTKSYTEWINQYNNEISALQKKRVQIEKNNTKLSEKDLAKQLSDVDAEIKDKQDKLKDLTGQTQRQRDAALRKAETAQQKADRKSAKEMLETEKNTNNESKRRLDLLKQVRKQYEDLNTQARSLNDGTEEGLRASNEMLSKIPDQINSIFSGDEYRSIISEELYKDENYKKYITDLIKNTSDARKKVSDDLSKLKTDVSDSNDESIKTWLNELKQYSSDIDFEAFNKKFQETIDQQKKAIDARNKLFSEEPPEGTGFAFRLSKIMTDVRNDVTQKGKEITSALVGATDEQKAALEQLGQAWTDAYNEEGMQKAEKLAQSYFNEFLKKQKLDIDMGSLSSATMSQLNRLRDALKAIETEFTGKGLVDAFDAVGLSIENLKGYIDTTNLSTVKKSLSDLISFTPEDVQLSEEQKTQLEAILKIVNALYQNNKKGLFDVNLEKLKKFKEIADEIAGAFGEIGSALEQLGEATGNTGLSSLAQDMQFASEMAGNIGNVVTGIMSKDPKAIIQGAVGIATTLIKGEAEYQKARLEFLKQQRSLQTDYNALLIEQIRLQKEGANGVLFDDLVENFRAAFKASEAAIKQLNELYTRGTIKISSGSAIQDLINPKYKPTENLEEYLSSIMVQTGTKRKKFLGITTGSKAVYGDLLTAYPALIDETGKLDLEYAKLIVSQNNFKGQGKEALEELIAYAEQYEEAMQEMDDQLNSMFGGIGSLISDALISSFQNGKLSAKDFFDTVNKGIGDMLDSLVSNMVMAAVFGDMLDEYQQAIKDALLSDDPQANLTKIMGNLVGDINNGYTAAAAAMDLYNDAKQKAGLGSVNDVAREGLSEGYAKATQESIDVLTGVTYAALEKLSITANNTNAINMNVSAMSAELQTQTAILRVMSTHTERIPYIESGINTMVNRGVKLQ